MRLVDARPGRPNLYASRGRPRGWLATHVDTVPPHLPPVWEGRRLRGRGAADAKGCVTAMVEAARRRIAAGGEVPGLLFLVDEERGHAGAIAAREVLGADAPVALVLGEPTGNRWVRAHKGVLRVRVEATGRSAHSAFPERGHSAIDRLVEVLAGLRAIEFPADADLGATTVNVGRIEGGEAANVVAAAACAEMHLRLARPRAEVEPLLAGLVGEGLVVSFLGGNDPVRLVVPPGAASITVPFNTDAPYLDGLCPISLLGPGAIEVAHGPDEAVELDEVIEASRLYVEAIPGWSK